MPILWAMTLATSSQKSLEEAWRGASAYANPVHLMRRCNMTAVDIVKRGNNGLVCKRYCDTFPSRTCMAKCDALGKKICAESSELQRRPDAGLSMFRADAAGKHVKWQVNPRKDAFFHLSRIRRQVPSCRRLETAVPAHGGYEPRMPGTLNWSVGLQICSIRKATAPAIYPVYVLAANANAHERELYTTLGARVIDLTKDNRTVQSWQPQTFWKPTFSPGKHLPQLRRDGWLTYFKFTVFRFQSWVRRGIFLDADVAVLSQKLSNSLTCRWMAALRRICSSYLPVSPHGLAVFHLCLPPSI